MTERTRGPLRLIQALAATIASAALLIGPPAFLWWVSGQQLIPELGPGGFTDIWATLRAGQVPDDGIFLACVALGWVIWAYLSVVFATEFAATWRDRAAGIEVRDLSGVRWIMSKLAGWILAGNTAMASAFLVAPDIPIATEASAMVLEPHDTDESDAQPRPGQPSGTYDFHPDAYLNFTESTPKSESSTALDRSAIPANYERPIVPGDNLWTIAETLTGDGMNYHEIWAATDLGALVPEVDPRNPDLIFPGNVVRVPTNLMSDTTIEDLFGPQPSLTAERERPAGPIDPETRDRVVEPRQQPSPAPDLSVPAPIEAPVAPAEQPTEQSGQGFSNRAAATAVASVLGAAAAALIVAGIRRRRRRRQAGETGRRRARRSDRKAMEAERRLRAKLGNRIWAPEALTAAWNSLYPDNPGGSQPWCVRWNADMNVLEAAWTTDPLRPADPGKAPTTPGDESPWTLVTKEDRSGASKEIWTIAERDVPAERPQADAVPAMVGCADGRSDRPSDDGFWMNLEAAGTIAVESGGAEALSPEGVVRSFLLQMQANGPVEIYLLNTDLGLGGVVDQVYTDPLELETTIVTDITAAGDSWDQYESVFALRSDGRFTKAPKVVVGPSEDLQTCSHVLSLARAANIPVVVIGLGSMSQAWATFTVEASPEKHTIRFHEANAVVTFDHLSWASEAESDLLLHMIWEASDPTDSSPADLGPSTSAFDLPPVDLDLGEGWSAHSAPGEVSGWGADAGEDLLTRPTTHTAHGAESDTDGEVDVSPLETAMVAPPASSTPSSGGDELTSSMAPVADTSRVSTALADVEHDEVDLLADPTLGLTSWSIPHGDEGGAQDELLPDLDPATGLVGVALDTEQEPRAVAASSVGAEELWDSLPSADTDALFDAVTPDEEEDVGWAVATDDDEIDDIFGRSALLSLATGDDLETGLDQADVELEERLISALADTATLATAPDSGGGQADGGEERWSASLPLDDQGPSATAGPSGLRLEICGPVRVLTDTGDQPMNVVPMSGESGLTAGQLSLFALLGCHSKPDGGGGITAEEIASTFWSEYNADGTLRQVPQGTVKKKVYELRTALKDLLGLEDGKLIIPEAVDQRYFLSGVSCDWHELKEAIVGAEATETGSAPWQSHAETIMALVRPPGLFTIPTGRRAGPMFLWVEEYEPLIQDAVRRLGNILVDYAHELSEQGDVRAALRVLSKAREASPTYPWEIASAFVQTLLLEGDVGGAQAECEAYERQFEPGMQSDVPGSPRRILNEFLARTDSAES